VLESLDLSWVNALVWDLYDHGQREQRPFPPQAMLKALLLQRLKNIPSERKLAKFLEKEPRWARLCGFTKRKGTPTHACFSVF
jgi:transposase